MIAGHGELLSAMGIRAADHETGVVAGEVETSQLTLFAFDRLFDVGAGFGRKPNRFVGEQVTTMFGCEEPEQLQSGRDIDRAVLEHAVLLCVLLHFVGQHEFPCSKQPPDREGRVIHERLDGAFAHATEVDIEAGTTQFVVEIGDTDTGRGHQDASHTIGLDHFRLEGNRLWNRGPSGAKPDQVGGVEHDPC